ncbi:uncharacterized protein YecE (DUF72 family) [Panacagrimonas perspica]|uniref:Uncharacterized protein YecE (DUF72 family) n=1 Tax=Panacagrimonas perspica TaxID=381431 RepID=A0A4S3JYT2_9GAMM|nr:DUF72 domain-containing protein [Panacagrimonas perspica]TDU31333.1 uncharacterized protein YecE (DUF72 family) [Panacagrimonas perspica]THD00755.1 hypothetical protein B1810_22765 [Panacagrimonas perspica]
MQDTLFSDADEPEPIPEAPRARRAKGVQPASTDDALVALARALPPRLRVGTSSWNYPGWAGLVWDRDYPETKLSKQGLSAYARHPLFRTVSLDRAFYRPLSVEQYAAYAAQVPDDFRFVVKAPSLGADAMVRSENGRGMEPNAMFLDPDLALRTFAQPALEGLRHRVGALVFQLSPLPAPMLADIPQIIRRIGAMLRALPSLQPTAPDGVIAVEVRDAAFLTPAFARMLRECGATYCLGLHAKMPPIEEQLPMLRALWPGPLVCRWNLHRRHGAYGYEEAKRLYGAFDRIVDADPETHAALAKVIAATTDACYPAYVTLGNKAEGSAPLSAVQLAQVVRDRLRAR